MIGWKGALSSNLSLMNYNISVYYIERRCLDRPRISGMRSNFLCHLLQVTLHLETSLLCSTSWIYLVPLCHMKWFLFLVFNTPYIFVRLLVGFTGRPLFTKTKRKTSWPTERNTLLITEQRKPRHKSNEPCFRNLYSAFLYSVIFFLVQPALLLWSNVICYFSSLETIAPLSIFPTWIPWFSLDVPSLW